MIIHSTHYYDHNGEVFEFHSFWGASSIFLEHYPTGDLFRDSGFAQSRDPVHRVSVRQTIALVMIVQPLCHDIFVNRACQIFTLFKLQPHRMFCKWVPGIIPLGSLEDNKTFVVFQPWIHQQYHGLWREESTWAVHMYYLYRALWWQPTQGQVPGMLPHLLFLLSQWVAQKEGANQPRQHPMPQL